MMNWRSRPLALFLPIAFLFLPQPEDAWAQGRGHGYGHHHDHHHPSPHHFLGFGHQYGYASCGYGSPAGCGQTVIPGSPQLPAKEAPAAGSPRRDAAEGGEPTKARGHHLWVAVACPRACAPRAPGLGVERRDRHGRYGRRGPVQAQGRKAECRRRVNRRSCQARG